MSLMELMRREWDARARKDAFHYIASWKRGWDPESFLASGEEDFQLLVKSVFDRCEIPTGGRAMLELGCGAGRMTGSFARRWERAYALDISPEMLCKARGMHSEATNIVWLLSNGADLSCVAAGTIDFVFSYLVLQHLPSEELVFGYVREFLRVLRPGGAFLFQFNSSYKATMNLRGRLAWSMVDALWSARLIWLSRAAARIMGLDPATAGKTWHGAAINAERIELALGEAGGEVRELREAGTPMTWCCGVKRS